MEYRTLSFLALAATASCRQGSVPETRSSRGPQIPAGWAVVAPYDTGSEAARCANWAREQWRVTLTDRGTVRITPDSGWTPQREISLAGGRLVGIDHGEFGGGVWWVPATAGDSVLLTRENLHAFIPLASGEVLGLVGLVHMGIDTGAVLTFRNEGTTWQAIHLVNLGGAPTAYTRLGGDSLLIATTETLQLLRLPAHQTVLHRNPAWPYLYAGSLVRDASGAAYLGMRHAVARLIPSDSGFREDWLIPAACRTMRPTSDHECTCDGPPS